MKFHIKHSLFNLWYRFTPAMAARWLNRKLERAENSAANLLRRDCQAADELEIQCEEVKLPIRSKAPTAQGATNYYPFPFDPARAAWWQEK